MPAPSVDDKQSPPIRVLSPAWWVRDKHGGLSLAQWPNPALAVWLVAVIVGWTGALGPVRSATLTGIGRGALIVWAVDELVRGTSPFRRLLGAAILIAQLGSLFR